jgi:poly-gamma-glutamate synthesis protein (capsule biosynthesis protein)
VIELTGNHMNDYGVSNFRYSLGLYAQNNLPTFGGGANLTEARKPLMIENNGNKLAFIGCDFSPVAAEWATETDPGSAPCGDFAWMVNQISSLRAQGYLPIATFQYSEYYIFAPPENQVRDFGQMADAGAAIVSGSQSHFPMAMEFKGESFIHYGLGNLFFDQMNYELMDGTITTGTRREFIDRYAIYDNKVISLELLTAMLEDYSRPRPMTDTERAQLLEDIFSASGWR